MLTEREVYRYMLNFIAYFIAGVCVAGFVTIWFRSAYKELSAKHSGLDDLEDQLRLHMQLSSQVSDGPDARSAANMLETSRMLYREAARGYNRILRKPMNRLPALLMGFRAADDTVAGLYHLVRCGPGRLSICRSRKTLKRSSRRDRADNI